MAHRLTGSTAAAYRRRVHVIRFTLPFLLFAIVAYFELREHWLETGELEMSVFSGEVFFFGFVGPFAAFLALTYVKRLLDEILAMRERTDALNRDLERSVALRTAELHTANGELAAANKELVKLDQMKSELIELVSHELRAPLAALNGGLEVALQNTDDLPARTTRTLEVMRTESNRLSNLVQTILDTSQLDAGRLTFNPGPVAIGPLLKRVAETTVVADRHSMVWLIPRDMPPVLADEVYLEEIVRNLLANADRYSPPGQPVEVAVEVCNGRMCVSVLDYGPGIPLELQAGIFERFSRSATDMNGGPPARRWGLGLYFSRALAQAQGGTLTLQSPVRDDPAAPGTGFYLRMPIDEEPEDDGETAAH